MKPGFPMLRLKPNNTHAAIQRFETNIPALLTVENNQLTNEKVQYISFDGDESRKLFQL